LASHITRSACDHRIDAREYRPATSMMAILIAIESGFASA
jgi:hypothetical protein